MKNLRRFLPCCIVFVMLAALPGCLPYRTGPTEVGVRTVKWSLLGKKGVEDKVYAPGTTHFFVPFLTDWHTFDTRLQNLEMMSDEARGDHEGRDELLFKTVDGNDIGLDVIISYRIIPEKAPLILQEVATSDDELRESLVRTVARSKPRDIFGLLNTEDFYITTTRSKKEAQVAEALNEILGHYGVTIERVGTRDYRFNPKYQEAIEDKKVADQEAEKLQAETRAKLEEFLTKKEQARAETEKTRANADGDYERAVIEADAYYEKQLRVAEATLAEAKAEAEGIKSLNLALSGPGGDALLKLGVADALYGAKIVMFPMGGSSGLDLRTTDTNQWMRLFGGEPK